eukprot:8753963-Heterocapsa_arctica.AAC.1
MITGAQLTSDTLESKLHVLSKTRDKLTRVHVAITPSSSESPPCKSKGHSLTVYTRSVQY